ncbi:MAG: endonuclease [Bacilli bacterium]|nr:endonuclease [Bacilli bacterium]
MKKLLNKKILASVGLALGCVSTLIFSVRNDNTKSADAASYTASTLTKYIDLNDNTSEQIRDYYSSLGNLSTSERQGTNLLKNLKPILKNNQKYYKYDNSNAIWQIYEISDRDWDKSPASETTQGTYNASTNTISNYSYGSNSNKKDNPYVHALYVDRFISNPKTAWTIHNDRSNSACIEREHIWPKSHGFDAEEVAGARGDPMHLWAADGGTNGLHSNYFYGYVNTSKSYTKSETNYSWTGKNYLGKPKTFPSSDATVFEPQDTDKGDIARSCFYMVARYNNLAGNDSSIDSANPNLYIENGVSGNTLKGTSTSTNPFSLGILQDLLEWNRLDPPDEYEIHRNNLLYNNYTNNRNPFIDFPEWAEYIWGKSVDGLYNSSSTGYAVPDTDKLNKFGNGGEVPPSPGVNSVTVSPSSMQLDLNGTTTGNLTATVSVSNGASQEVSWTSSNTNVATVSSNGVVTAVAVGTCTITATSTVNSTKADSCTITVIDSTGGGGGDSGSFTWDLTISSFDENPTANLVTWSSDCATIKHERTNNNNTAANNYLGGLKSGTTDCRSTRFYKNNVLTISPSLNYVLTSIEFVATTENYANALQTSSWTNATTAKSGTTVTITPTNGGQNVVAQIGGTCGFTSITIEYDCTVINQKTLTGISLDCSNVQTEFEVDDTFDYSGLVVTANYSDGTSVVVEPNDVTIPDLSTAGTKTITVTYSENSVTKTATYEIEVEEPVANTIYASVDKVYHPGETILSCDIYVVDNLGNEVIDFEFNDDGYMFTYDDAGESGNENIKTFYNSVTYSSMVCDLEVSISRNAYVNTASYDDYLDRSLTGVTGNTYTAWSGKTLSSGVTYAGFSAGGNGSIQLRTTYSNSGVVSTANADSLSIYSVSVSWNSNTDPARKLKVYGSTTPFSSPADLFDNNGVFLGSIAYGDSSAFILDDSYQYIGLRSDYGALYLNEIIITYGSEGTAENVANYIMYADTNNQCKTKLDVVQGYFEDLSASEQETFMSSNDYVIASARTRLIAWAAHEGKTITTDSNGKYVISNSIKMTGFGQTELSDNNSIIILFIICSLGAGALSVCYLFKKKKSSR